MKLASLALVAALAVFMARPAGACQCVRKGAVAEYVPFPGSQVPSNVVPRVILYFGHEPAPGDWQVDLRLLCVDASASRVYDTTNTKQRGFNMGMVEFRPDRELPIGARCALVDRNRKIVTWFEVNEAADREPPAAPSLLGGHFASKEQSMCGPDHGAGGLRIAADDAANTLYAAWLGVRGEPPNYDDPPLTLSFVDEMTVKHMDRDRAGEAGTLMGNFNLSGRNECTPANFPYPQKGEATLGVKALDLAGNWSEPSEVRLAPLLPNSGKSYSFGSMEEPAKEGDPVWLLGLLFGALALGIAVLVAREEMD